MRNICTRFLAICLLSTATLGLAGILAAQEPSAPVNPPDEATAPTGQPERGGNVERRLEKLSQQLTLTDEQKQKIRPVLKHEVERIKEVRGNTSLSQEEARRRIQTIRINTYLHIREFLTPAQKKQWQEDRQQRGGPEGGQHEPGGGAPEAPPPRPIPSTRTESSIHRPIG